MFRKGQPSFQLRVFFTFCHPWLSLQAVFVEWLYVGEPGEFANSRRLQALVAKSQLHCRVVEHDFGRRPAGGFVASGHPWAALVAFDAALCAAMLQFQYVAVGNEASADAGNGIFLKKEMEDGKVERVTLRFLLGWPGS